VIVSVALLAVTVALDAGPADAGVRRDGGDARGGRDGGSGGDGPDGGAADSGAADAMPVPGPPAPPAGRLSGRVVAKGTRKPIAGAAITVDVAEAGATDAKGDFAVDVPCGLRRLWIQAPGFEPLARTVDPCAATEPLTLRLAPAATGQSFETVIRAKSINTEVRLAAEELTQTPGTLGDPFRAIESLPGVATILWPAPVYAVRGSNPGNTGYFLDGIRVPALFHFALGPSVIHPYLFDNLQFFPGGYPARFGRYAAGIITADTRPAADDRIHAAVDVRLYDAGALVSAPLPGGGTVTVAGRYSYTAALLSLLSPGVTVQYWDYQLRADRRFGPFQLTLLAFGSGDLLAPDNLVDPTNVVALGFHRISLRAVAPLAGGRVVASLAVGSDRSKAPIAGFPITVAAVSAAPRLAYLRSFAPADIALGFDGELSRYDPVTTVLSSASPDWDLARRRNVYLLAGYASATVRAGSRLVVTPELRYDSYQVSGVRAGDLGPRLTARLALRDDTAIKAAGGRFTQLPSLPLQIPGAEAFGLRLLGLQSAWQASLGVETSRLEAVDLAVTGYVQRYVLTDMRDPRVEIDPLSADFLVKRDALSYGIEVLARRPVSQRLHGWLSYTLSNNLRSFGAGVVGPSDWDQRHILNLVAGYRIGRTTLGGRFHLNTGRPFIVYNVGGSVVQRLPTFYQVDLRIDRRVIYDKFIFNFYIELVNATLSRQVVGVTETYDGQFREDSFRIVLPSIGVRGEF
jgi:hypothetical protein